MPSQHTTHMKSHRRSGKGILFGIPLLLFISGIILLSIGSYDYLKYAFYFSRLFIHDEVKLDSQSVNLLDKTDKKAAASVKKIQFPSLGEEFGELMIESASIDYPVYHGDRDEDLLKGIGHYNGSRYPGEGGNVVLDGHRNSVFKRLGKVKVGDTVIFQTTYGKYVYTVKDIRITSGSDKTIVQPADSEKLTLYTCYPFAYIGHAPKRYVVTCDLTEGTPLKELLAKEGKTP